MAPCFASRSARLLADASVAANTFAACPTHPRSSLADCIVAAVGTTTAGALRERGIEPDVIPKQPDSRQLVEALAAHVQALRREGEDR